MIKVRGMSRLLATSLLAMPFTAAAVGEQPSRPLGTRRVDPKEFGITDDTITVLSATRFNIQTSFGWSYTPTFGLSTALNTDVHYYTDLDLPAGAVIDMIGLNSTTDTDGILGVELWFRNDVANLTPLAGFSTTAHDWGMDYSGPLNIQITTHQSREYILDVENAPSPNAQYFGWVEVWWHRSVSPPPGTATFNDVPTTHPFFQYVEALAASGVTGGCQASPPLYCPDSPLTRGQMAVFLAKALGLHWPL